MAKVKELKHEGLRADRIIDDGPEKIFAELWLEENKRLTGINHGYITFECILNTVRVAYCGEQLEGHLFTEPTQRDADVAATIIQWLGTGIGKCFLEKAEHQIKEWRKAEQKKFDDKYNKQGGE